MKCIACGASVEKGLTTSVTDLGNCLAISVLNAMRLSILLTWYST